MHSMCSYMAMFPPTIPHVFTRWLTSPGDVVYDPFCGRGTAPFEAGLLGRVGLGSDQNPLAVVLTGAKVDPPSTEEVSTRIGVLREQAELRPSGDTPDHIKDLFHPQTLAQLLWLREELDQTDRTDRFLLAVLVGSLHLNAGSDGVPRGLTVAMPNTFAMSPGYVSRYIAEHNLKAPNVDVVDFLESRAKAFPLPGPEFRRGWAWRQDAATLPRWPEGTPEAKLVFTSPPYLEVIRYGKFNWIRLWVLGADPKDLDRALFTSSSMPLYQDFMREVIASASTRLRSDGFMCLVIGDVRRKEKQLNLALEVERASVPSHLEVVGTSVDRLPTKHKVSRIWGSNRGRATKIDRVLILKGVDADTPPLGRLSWA